VKIHLHAEIESEMKVWVVPAVPVEDKPGAKKENKEAKGEGKEAKGEGKEAKK
jgi:hypothetical protein